MTAADTLPSPARHKAPGRMPGIDGFWVFIGGDMAIFTLMFWRSSPAAATMSPPIRRRARHFGCRSRWHQRLDKFADEFGVWRRTSRLREGRTDVAPTWTAFGVLGGLAFGAQPIRHRIPGRSRPPRARSMST